MNLISISFVIAIVLGEETQLSESQKSERPFPFAMLSYLKRIHKEQQ